MSDVFVAFEESDRVAAGRLIRGLERAGFAVWSHADLPGGENWQSQVESALESAKCVVVLWTKKSVGPEGDFVREEARWAKNRGILLPVLLDKVDPPLGFGEIQTIDLSRWGGSQRNARFKDLRAAVQARIEGGEIPAAEGPKKRLMQRITMGAAASAALAVIVIGFNLFSAQIQICSMPPFQPAISDACGALGLASSPTKAERLSWEARELGSCQALREHIEAFPHGALRDAAANLVAARQITQTEIWVPAERRLVIYVSPGVSRQATEAAAREDALERGAGEAERLCRGFSATTSFRLNASAPEVQTWNCSSSGDGVSCGFDGEAVCQLELRRIVESEVCRGG